MPELTKDQRIANARLNLQNAQRALDAAVAIQEPGETDDKKLSIIPPESSS